MQFRRPVSPPPSEFNIKKLGLTNQDKTFVSKVMVYSLHGYNRMMDKVIIYTANKVLEDEESKSIVGIICVTGMLFLSWLKTLK